MKVSNFFSKLPSTLIVCNKLVNNYYILKQFETGICLYGWEIKSFRQKRVEISKAYVTIYKKEVFVNNLLIQPLNNIQNNTLNNIKTSKKLLLHKKEIYFLENQIKQKGYTIILICLYWKYKKCKALISIAKGKQNFLKKKDNKKN